MNRKLLAIVSLLSVLFLFVIGSVAFAAPPPSPYREIDPQAVLAFLKATLALVWSYAGVKVIAGACDRSEVVSHLSV